MTFVSYLAKLEGLYRGLELSAPHRRAAAPVSRLQAVERELDCSVPEGLRAAWRTTNGLGDYQTVFARPGWITAYDFLSVEDALAERKALRRRAPQYSGYEERKPRDVRIRAGWFEEGWLPFGGFGGGTLLLILDLSPARTGKRGQIIAYIHDPDRIEYVAPSFAALLKDSMKAIASNPGELLAP